jgi:sugar-specific transcriptional regulator TrmB
MGGYALAKVLSIARANAYQALNGLEAKGAVIASGDEPRRFRPVAPDALFAQIVDRQSRQLDALETALRPGGAATGAADTVRIRARRSLEELLLRTAARTKDLVQCIAPAAMLERLVPAWHKRIADGLATRLWAIGEGGDKLPIPLTGRRSLDAVAEPLGGPPVILVSTGVAIAAVLPAAESEVQGFWSNDQILVGLTGSLFKVITTA